MTVPITSDLVGYAAFWKPVVCLLIAEQAAIIALLLVIALRR